MRTIAVLIAGIAEQAIARTPNTYLNRVVIELSIECLNTFFF
jgi:hypothetical protein